jgi:hypothetical protein
MSKHHVKRHRWINGTLNTYTTTFENLDEALIFAKSAPGDSIKVYNAEGECVHEVATTPQNTYA